MENLEQKEKVPIRDESYYRQWGHNVQFYIEPRTNQTSAEFYAGRAFLTAFNKNGYKIIFSTMGDVTGYIPDRSDWKKDRNAGTVKRKGCELSGFLLDENYSDKELVELTNAGMFEYCNWFTYIIRKEGESNYKASDAVLSTTEECLDILDMFLRDEKELD